MHLGAFKAVLDGDPPVVLYHGRPAREVDPGRRPRLHPAHRLLMYLESKSRTGRKRHWPPGTGSRRPLCPSASSIPRTPFEDSPPPATSAPVWRRQGRPTSCRWPCARPWRACVRRLAQASTGGLRIDFQDAATQPPDPRRLPHAPQPPVGQELQGLRVVEQDDVLLHRPGDERAGHRGRHVRALARQLVRHEHTAHRRGQGAASRQGAPSGRAWRSRSTNTAQGVPGPAKAAFRRGRLHAGQESDGHGLRKDAAGGCQEDMQGQDSDRTSRRPVQDIRMREEQVRGELGKSPQDS